MENFFRGGGRRTTDDEKLAHPPGVDIYFQKKNAWMDTSVCMERREKILTQFCTQEKLSRYVLFLDNFEAHTKYDFKILVNSLNGVVWFRLSNATDLWQPVDAGYSQVLKSLISIEHHEWVEFDSYGDRWFCNEQPFSAKEHCILLNNWAGNAWEKL